MIIRERVVNGTVELYCHLCGEVVHAAWEGSVGPATPEELAWYEKNHTCCVIGTPQNGAVRMIDFNRLYYAVLSITTCTAPVVQVEKVVAEADCLCSPYASRHTVSFREAEYLPEGVIYAGNSRYELWLDFLPYVRGQIQIRPRPFEGYQHEAVSMRVPSSQILPVVRLAERLVGDLPFVRRIPNWIPDLVYVHLSRPVLAGFSEDGRPLFQEMQEA